MGKKKKMLPDLRDPKVHPSREIYWSLRGHDRDVLTYTSPALMAAQELPPDPHGSAGEDQGRRVELGKRARAERRLEVEIRDERIT